MSHLEFDQHLGQCKVFLSYLCSQYAVFNGIKWKSRKCFRRVRVESVFPSKTGQIHFFCCFLSFVSWLRKLNLVRLERISCGSEILCFQFSGMVISSSTAFHFSVEFKKCRAILGVAFCFIYRIPLNSTVFRISWEDYFC